MATEVEFNNLLPLKNERTSSSTEVETFLKNNSILDFFHI